jgi:hypothetical protein
MSAIWESANWTRQFGTRQTENRQFGMLPLRTGICELMNGFSKNISILILLTLGL